MEKSDLQELINSGVLEANPDIHLVQDELNKLADQGLIKKLSDQFFEFENNLTWEVVYETLLYSERRRLHNLVAQHIEKQNEGQAESVYDVLAYHYEKAGNISKSIWYLALEGDRAAEMYANDDALNSYKRALDLLDEGDKLYLLDKGLVLEKIADVHKTTGRYKESTEYYQEVLGNERNNKVSKRISKNLPWKYRTPTRISELCWKIAVSIESQSEYEKAINWLEEALESLPKRPGRVATKITSTMSVVLYRLGRYKDAILWGMKAYKHAKRLKIDEEIARAQNILGIIYLAEGKMKIASNRFSEAAEVYNRLENYPYIAITKSNLAMCSMMMGDLSSAIEDYLKALDADKRIQNVSNMSMDHTNLAEVMLMTGDISKAEEHLEYVENAFTDGLCPPDLAGLAFVHLSRCKMINGDYQESRDTIEQGLELIRNAGQKVILGQAELQLADLLCEQGKYAEAEEICLSALVDIEELGMKPLEVIGKRILAEVKHEQGYEDDAIEYIHDSIELAKEIAAKYDEAKSVVVMVKIMREMKNAPLRKKAQDNCLARAMRMLTEMGAKRELEKAKKLVIH